MVILFNITSYNNTDKSWIFRVLGMSWRKCFLQMPTRQCQFTISQTFSSMTTVWALCLCKRTIWEWCLIKPGEVLFVGLNLIPYPPSYLCVVRQFVAYSCSFSLISVSNPNLRVSLRVTIPCFLFTIYGCVYGWHIYVWIRCNKEAYLLWKTSTIFFQWVWQWLPPVSNKNIRKIPHWLYQLTRLQQVYSKLK